MMNSGKIPEIVSPPDIAREKIDKLEAKISDLESDLEGIVSSIEILSDASIKNSEFFKEFLGALASKASTQSKFNSDHEAKFSISEGKFAEVHSRVENLEKNINDSIDRIHQKHADHAEQVVKSADLQSHLNPVMNRVELSEKQSVVLLSMIRDLEKKLNYFQELAIHGQSYHNDRISEVEEKHQELSQDVQLIHRSVRNFDSVSDSKDKWVAAQFDQKLDSVKEQIQLLPNTAEAVEKKISSRLDLLQYDTSNALLKSSNVSEQIRLIERKIENILALIKKQEIMG